MKSCGLLEDQSHLTDLETILKLLSAPQIRAIAKEMAVTTKGGQNKSDFVGGLLKHAQKKSIFGSANTVESKVRKKAVAALGQSFRITEGPRIIFRRYEDKKWR